jgi:hypothetical protein
MAPKYGKYGSKYIISKYQPHTAKQAWSATYIPGKEETHILYIGDDVLKGAFYTSAGWFWPAMVNRKPEEGASKPHSHPYDEVLGLVGTNRDDPHDLGGVAEITLDGETHIIDKSCLIYIPAGLKHGPFKQTKITRPIFHFNSGMTGTHI